MKYLPVVIARIEEELKSAQEGKKKAHVTALTVMLQGLKKVLNEDTDFDLGPCGCCLFAPFKIGKRSYTLRTPYVPEDHTHVDLALFINAHVRKSNHAFVTYEADLC